LKSFTLNNYYVRDITCVGGAGTFSFLFCITKYYGGKRKKNKHKLQLNLY